MTKIPGDHPSEWAVADAKAHFSELIDKALTRGPQVVTRHGRPQAVVVSTAEWERRSKRKGTLAEFLAASPLHDFELDLERLPDGPRDLDL